MAETRNFLSRKKIRKFEDYFLNNWDKVRKQRPKKDEFIEIAKEDLGFDITLSNLNGVLRMFDKKWPSPLKGKGHYSKLKINKDDAKALAKAVTYLTEELGLEQGVDMERLKALAKEE